MATIRSLHAAIVGWWTGSSEARKQTSIAIAALVVAIIALAPVLSDLTASPEEKLSKLGYKKTYDDFWRAIYNKHVEAVSLYTKSKARLEPRDFHRLFDDRTFDLEVFGILADGKSIDSKQCPTDIDGVALYPAHGNNPDKVKAIRRICAKPEIISKISAAREGEFLRISAARLADLTRTDRIRACVLKYRSENQRQLMEEASRFDLLSRRTLTERQCVLAQISIGLLVGGDTVADAEQLLVRSIGKCCTDSNQPTSLGDSRLRSADYALTMLKEI